MSLCREMSGELLNYQSCFIREKYCFHLIIGGNFFRAFFNTFCSLFFLFRNDLYLVIERGDFERGGKSSNKNIEVTAIVVDELGNHLQVLQ